MGLLPPVARLLGQARGEPPVAAVRDLHNRLHGLLWRCEGGGVVCSPAWDDGTLLRLPTAYGPRHGFPLVPAAEAARCLDALFPGAAAAAVEVAGADYALLRLWGGAGLSAVAPLTHSQHAQLPLHCDPVHVDEVVWRGATREDGGAAMDAVAAVAAAEAPVVPSLLPPCVDTGALQEALCFVRAVLADFCFRDPWLRRQVQAVAALGVGVETHEVRAARASTALGRMTSFVHSVTVAADAPSPYEACTGLCDYLRALQEYRYVLPPGRAGGAAGAAEVQLYLASWLAADVCDPRRAWALLRAEVPRFPPFSQVLYTQGGELLVPAGVQVEEAVAAWSRATQPAQPTSILLLAPTPASALSE